MPEIERLDSDIAWIDLSFVERQRTPGWAIQVGIRCHLSGMSLRDASQHLEQLGVSRSHVAIHDWVHKAELQPISTVTKDQIAVDEKMIHINGDDHWPYGAIERVFSEIERRTSSFATSFSHVDAGTAQSWLEAFAVYHNSRQK